MSSPCGVVPNVCVCVIYIYIYIYIYTHTHTTAFYKFPDFIQVFKIVVDSWKFSILLRYILWDYWPIFMISRSNEQLQQELEYTLLNLIVTAGEFQKCSLDMRTL